MRKIPLELDRALALKTRLLPASLAYLDHKEVRAYREKKK